jgi:hypothetical protein
MRGGREVRLGSFSLPAACLDVNSSSLITDACVCVCVDSVYFCVWMCVCVWTPYISVCGCVCGLAARAGDDSRPQQTRPLHHPNPPPPAYLLHDVLRRAIPPRPTYLSSTRHKEEANCDGPCYTIAMGDHHPRESFQHEQRRRISTGCGPQTTVTKQSASRDKTRRKSMGPPRELSVRPLRAMCARCRCTVPTCLLGPG